MTSSRFLLSTLAILSSSCVSCTACLAFSHHRHSPQLDQDCLRPHPSRYVSFTSHPGADAVVNSFLQQQQTLSSAAICRYVITQQWVSELFPGVKRMESKANHSLLLLRLGISGAILLLPQDAFHGSARRVARTFTPESFV